VMRLMSMEALYRRPRMTQRHPAHAVCPYLLRRVAIRRPNPVWAMDISVPEQAAREMRVWPLAIGLQKQVANHRKRLGSKARS
jgi:transposase InsO family protein